MKYLKMFETFNITIAYHGTPNGGFDKFDYNKRGAGADKNGFGDWGNGFYFTKSKKTAISYAKGLAEEGLGNKPYVYTVNLIINNPFSFEKLYQFDKDFWLKIQQNQDSGREKTEGELLNISDEQYNELLVKNNTTEAEIDFMRDLESDLADNWGDWDITAKLKDKGYDSLFAKKDSKHSNEIVVFNSAQIQILKKEPLIKYIKKLFESQKPIPSYDDLSYQLRFRTSKGSNPFDRLNDKQHRENIDFDVYLPSKGFNLQRDFVWSLFQKRQFIFSILRNNPIPSIAVIKHKEKNGDYIYQIIDGKQRIKAYVDFCDGLFTIIINGHEYYYDELPEKMKNHINRFSFQGSVGFSYYNEPITDEDKIRWFEQLNFGGTPQDEEHINKLKKSL